MSDCVLLIKYTITYLLQNNESGYIKQIKEGKNMKLAMGCDPAAYRFYKKLLERMKEEGYDIVDTGCESENEADGGKYAEIAEIVSNKVVSKECDYGILICGTGQGMAMAANKIPGIRAVLCYDVFPAVLSKNDNNGNVLCTGAWFMEKKGIDFTMATLSMTDDNVKEATKRAIETAKNNGLIISFDPNLRPPLWKSLDDARNQIAYGLSQCDVLKISDNEIEFMTGTSDFDKGANILMERYPNIKLLNITAGADGSYSYYREIRAYVPSYLLGGTIDTTGAGDTFCGSVLNYLLDHDLENLSKENLIEMLQIANAAAYLVTTKKGAIRSMPDPKDVQKVVNNNYIRED